MRLHEGGHRARRIVLGGERLRVEGGTAARAPNRLLKVVVGSILLLPHGRGRTAHSTVLAGIEAATDVHRRHHGIIKTRVHASCRLREVISLMLLMHGVICVILRWLLNHLHHAWVLRHLMMRKTAMNKGLLRRVRVAPLTTALLIEEDAIVLCV